MAETKGFEPSRRFPVCALSRGVPSTTRPRLRRLVYGPGHRKTRPFSPQSRTTRDFDKPMGHPCLSGIWRIRPAMRGAEGQSRPNVARFRRWRGILGTDRQLTVWGEPAFRPRSRRLQSLIWADRCPGRIDPSPLVPQWSSRRVHGTG
jgi:hypothetical protein